MKKLFSLLTLFLSCAAFSAHGESDESLPLLRGVLNLGSTQTFSLSNASGSETSWLDIGQSFDGYKLTAYNSKAQQLSLEKDGETVLVGLAAAKLSSEAGSPEERLAEAEALMEQMKFEQMMDEMMGAQMGVIGDMMRQQMGDNVDEELLEFQTKVISEMFTELDWEPIKKGMTNAYADVFTSEELRGMSNFYTTPAGKASLSKMPEIQSKTMEVMMPAMMEASQNVQKKMMDFYRQRSQAKKETTEE